MKVVDQVVVLVDSSGESQASEPSGCGSSSTCPRPAAGGARDGQVVEGRRRARAAPGAAGSARRRGGRRIRPRAITSTISAATTVDWMIDSTFSDRGRLPDPPQIEGEVVEIDRHPAQRPLPAGALHRVVVGVRAVLCCEAVVLHVDEAPDAETRGRGDERSRQMRPIQRFSVLFERPRSGRRHGRR